MTKAEEWAAWNKDRRAEKYHGFSLGRNNLNAVKTEANGFGAVYVEACPEADVPIEKSITSRCRYSNRPGTAAAVGCWSYYEDLPRVRERIQRGYWL